MSTGFHCDPIQTTEDCSSNRPRRSEHEKDCAKREKTSEGIVATPAGIAATPRLAADDPLWQRTENFDLDLPLVGLSFSERLAKENAWSLTYARRAIFEYKRFLYLAIRSGHVACPSESVDQVWHMHLTYTRSYWTDLCGKVLEQPLHHGPTKGGSEEREKYFQLYERTQSSYERYFGEAVPEDIWPEPEVRFGRDLHFVRVNTADHWILPKLGWRRMALGAGAAGVLVPAAQLAINPLDWSGSSFLLLFACLGVIGLVVTIVGRMTALGPRARDTLGNSASEDPVAEIQPVEAAWLAGGKSSAMTCAMVELAQQGAIELEVGGQAKSGPNASRIAPTERLHQLVLSSVTNSVTGRSLRGIYRDANVGVVALQQKMEEAGLAVSSGQRATAVMAAMLPLGGLACLGAAKIVIGLGRARPVGFLVAAEIAVVVMLVIAVASIPRLTEAGNRLLGKLKKKANTDPESLSQTTANNGLTPADGALIWGAALLGPPALMGTPYEELGTLKPDGAAASGGCGATGCGGDAGCGGGGGCGGGCGGCGG